MKWPEVRKKYPHQWVLIEALKAHSKSDKRVLDSLCVVNAYQDISPAILEYKHLHHYDPNREFYVVHTDKKNLEIYERRWLGIRTLQ